MKILHVISSLDPARGGPITCVMSLAAAQAYMGCTVQLASYRDATWPTDGQSRSIPYFDQVSLSGVSADGVIERLFAWQASKMLHDLIKTNDVIHLHGVWDPILLQAGRIARQAGKPYVITSHGALNTWSLAQKRLKKQLILALFVRRQLNNCAFIHALNTMEAECISALRLNCPTRILPNGIFPEEFANLPPQGTLENRYPQLHGRRYILFLGRLHLVKGLDYLAEAFAQVASEAKDLDLVVVGPDEGAQKEFEQRISSHSLQGRVHLLGPLYGSDKYAALRDAVCLVQPSRQEGFSMAITEALAYGIPVVISESCYFPEVAENNAGEVVRLNADELAQAILRIATDPERRTRMSIAGQELVLTHYTWHSVAADFVREYRGVITHTGV
ncbi:MAG: glycosyltransferase [Gammaproteobacteria bacterium]|nr:glycosyltransferase [Gammaproteobacteria bacterium]MBU2479276.1 glycosyltransferase [Gammaproteobacteria bacterium]